MQRGVCIIKVFRTVTVVLIVLWMALIFSLSSQNAEISSETSGSVIVAVADIVYPDFSEMPSEKQMEIVASLQFIVRKIAHFSLYAVLGILSFLSVISYRQLKFSYRFLISAGICLLYAVSDELHQLFVSGRSSEIRDVCIDFCGSLIAITVLSLLARCVKKVYKIIRTAD